MTFTGKRYIPPKGTHFCREHEFKKGHIPWNVTHKEEYREKIYINLSQKLKNTWFKKGHRPLNTKPIGTIVWRKHKKAPDGGDYWIKTGKKCNQWMMYNRYLWEKHKGKIPPKHLVSYIDGDHKKCKISNLRLISMADNARRNSNYEADGYIAATLAKNGNRVDKELKNKLLKCPDVLELKRQQLKLKRLIDGQNK